MVTLDMIRKPVEGDLEAFEQFIRQKFTADGTLLSEMLDYALSARGKGIRPMTVLLSAALNAPAGQRSGGLRTLLAATLVEMIHVASLIHDDVIDESPSGEGLCRESPEPPNIVNRHTTNSRHVRDDLCRSADAARLWLHAGTHDQARTDRKR